MSVNVQNESPDKAWESKLLVMPASYYRYF